MSLTKLGYARITVAAGTHKGIEFDVVQQACPLVIVDEADRLSIKSLEHLRDLFDRQGFGLILMGMPGLEKRLARYAQFYSRIGFVHEFKPLTEAELRLLLAKHAGDFGIAFDPTHLDAIEAQAAIIRITRGNFRLVERLFAQIKRIMALNRVEQISADIVQAARDCMVIGPGN
jgi:DNA transposition AAA+ family ATPase